MGINNILNLKRGKRKEEYCSAIIAAAGSGKRMNMEINKQFINIFDKPVLAYTLGAFQECNLIDEIIVVSREEDILYCKDIINEFNMDKVTKIVAGGNERYESIYNGLNEINELTTIVAIHDGARLLVLPEDIEAAVETAIEQDSAVLGVRVKDTIKYADKNNNIIDTPDRNNLWVIQTPQVFRTHIIKDSYEKYFHDLNDGLINEIVTDDSMVVERAGYKVKIVEGNYSNIKITTPEDLSFAEAILNTRL